MKLREIAVAVAAFSLAGAAVAAGNDTSTTSERMPTARQGQPLEQSTQAQQERQGQSNVGNAAGASSSMGSGKMSNPAHAGSQGGMASEEHNPQVVRSVQEALKQKGYDVGTIDGQLGPNTQGALRQFQQAQGISQSGNLDQQTLSALGVDQNAGAQGAMSSAPGNAATSRSHSSSTQGGAYK